MTQQKDGTQLQELAGALLSALGILLTIASVLALGIVAVGTGTADAKTPTKTVRLSVKNSNHKEVKGAASDYPAISANGHLVAFESFGHLASNDKDMAPDVYVYNRSTHKNTMVSVKSNGKAGPNVGCAAADISPNGRYVSFGCEGALVGGDQNNKADIYRHDMKTGKTILISLTDAGAQLNGVNDDSEISGVADNGKVAWESYGAFVTGDANTAYDVFVRDPKAGTTVRASVDYQGNELPNGVGSLNPDKQSKIPISGNGRYVAFSSPNKATADDDYGMAVDTDVFVRDLKAGKTTRVSLRSNGKEADATHNADSSQPSISANGRYVSFVADPSAKFQGNDTNNSYDVYLHDRKTGKTRLVSVKSNGKQPAVIGGVDFPEISANGRFIVWDTTSNYGGGPDPANTRDVYRRDVKTKRTQLVSLSAGNRPRADYNQLGDTSNSGYVAFSSMGKLTGGDDGMDFDVFLRGPMH